MRDKKLFEFGALELLNRERFYAEFLHLLKRVPVKGLGTMGVGYDGESAKLVLSYDPEFMEKENIEGVSFGCGGDVKIISAVIKHELLHIIMEHLVRADPRKLSQVDRMRYNIAMDCAINQYIGGLPDGTITLQVFKEKYLKDGVKPSHVESNREFEYYLDLMKTDEQLSRDGQISYEFDSHDGFGEEGSGVSEEVLREQIRETVKQAAKRTEAAAGCGSIPGEITEIIKAYKSVRSWKKEIADFIARTSSVYTEVFRNRRNRRQRKDAPLIPGNRNKESLKLVFAIDTSGSMSSAVLAQVAGELARINEESEAHITIIECDTQVNHVCDFNRKHVEQLELHGRGGTRVKPVFDYIKEQGLNVDGIIYATDGEIFEDEFEKPPCPVLWMLPTSSHSIPINWGRKAYIKK